MTRCIVVIAFFCLLLVGCGDGEKHADLRDFVKKSDDLPRGRIPPLPEAQPYEPFTYNAFDLTDPFKPRSIQPPKAAAVAGGVSSPDLNRRKEPLEAYPLENLKMVGTLQQEKAIFAVVRTPDNRLFRVQQGNFLGQNFGRITEISESGIKLHELVQDSGGEWKEQQRILQLGEAFDPQQVSPVEYPQQVSRQDRENIVPVLFGTNRKKSGKNRPEDYFLSEEAESSGSSSMTLGRLIVRIPKHHKPGVIEEPGWIRVTLERVQNSTTGMLNVAPFKAVDPDLHFSFAYPIEELTPADFRSDLRKLLGKSKGRAALLYVHGYANSFKDAAYRAAQLNFDLRVEGYDIVPLLFSWPSDPSGVNYLGAKDRIRSAAGQLADFLNKVVDSTGVGVVHIIAHSMGADVLVQALDKLGEANLVAKDKNGRSISKFHQIVLAAPDIRASDFEKVIAPAIVSRHRVTNYASSNDSALRLSRKGNAGLRAGDTEGGPVPADGVETIDASTVNSELLGHAFFAESPAVVRDLRRLLRDNARPGARGLNPVRRATWTYWQFP